MLKKMSKFADCLMIAALRSVNAKSVPRRRFLSWRTTNYWTSQLDSCLIYLAPASEAKSYLSMRKRARSCLVI